jgi:hypothetical protein
MFGSENRVHKHSLTIEVYFSYYYKNPSTLQEKIPYNRTSLKSLKVLLKALKKP